MRFEWILHFSRHYSSYRPKRFLRLAASCLYTSA
jgi:hypothetical protein